VRQPSRVARAAKCRQEREDAQGQSSCELLLPLEPSIQTIVETVRPLCLCRRVRKLISDEEGRHVVQESLEAAMSRTDHFDPDSFIKSLLPLG